MTKMNGNEDTTVTESQRDSSNQPKVARNELPWVDSFPKPVNPIKGFIWARLKAASSTMKIGVLFVSWSFRVGDIPLDHLNGSGA
jgi:hypothetical protein